MGTAAGSRKSTYFLGVSALALSAVGLLLFFMPVLGIPLAGCGLLFALAALLAAFVERGEWDLRWAIFGLVLSLVALTINVIVVWPPRNTIPHQAELTTPSPAARPYVSPPAEP
jgi:hypothetical protein